jgi:hypothetical protein
MRQNFLVAKDRADKLTQLRTDAIVGGKGPTLTAMAEAKAVQLHDAGA